MAVTDKELINAAKSLIDNRDFNVIMDYMENDLLMKLTQGSPEHADNNLRNLKAALALKQGTRILANGSTTDKT